MVAQALISGGNMGIKTFWQFSRPHTIIGTSLQVTLACLLASTKLDWAVWIKALFSCLCVNIYVVGLNQIIDIDIDRINKPFLPLASGAYSKKQGVWITAVSGILALTTAALQSPFLFWTVFIIFGIGTLYSMPRVFLKGSPFWAALAIATARGLVLNLGAFFHFQKSLDLPWNILAFAFFVFGFGISISLMKDIPDMDGDRKFGVNTLSVRLGAKPVLYIALSILTLSYLALTSACLIRWDHIGPLILAVTHTIILGYLWFRATRIQFSWKESTYSFYMKLWKFFYIEYFLFYLAHLH